MAATSVLKDPTGSVDDIFASVFPSPDFTTPTPEVTPNIGVLASPGRPFGGFDASVQAADDDVRYNRAWSAATRFLSLPIDGGGERRATQVSPEVREALDFVCSSASTFGDLTAWYTNEITRHFRLLILPELQPWQQSIPSLEASSLVLRTVELLHKAQQHYLEPLGSVLSSTRRKDRRSVTDAFMAEIKQNLHVVVLHSMPKQRLQKTLASIMYHRMKLSLLRENDPEKCRKKGKCQCKLSLKGLPLTELHGVGLGGSLGERAFAHAVHKLIRGPAIERVCFKVDWSGHSTVVGNLRQWILHQFAPFVQQTLSVLNGNSRLELPESDDQQFANMAISSLGHLRSLSLFDYIKIWPYSKGAILDIKECLAFGGSSDKALVCSSFTDQVQHRLLHAGAGTSEILSVYINTIHAFKMLDARGVLLEKVAVPIRSHLRARDDTVNIIAASFLADADRDGNVQHADLERVCSDITREVTASSQEDHRDSKTLNWNDMEWVPDPIDAGPDYKGSRSEDIIALILGLFEQEDFVKEITTVLAQHLLQTNDSDYSKETRLVELFKTRLDVTKLQAAEVMLKDVQESITINKRINPDARYGLNGVPTPREIQAAIPDQGITPQSLWRLFEHRMKHSQFLASIQLVANKRQDLLFPKRTRLPQEPSKPTDSQTPDFRVQIISGSYWPEMRSNTFNMPAAFDRDRLSFTTRFEQTGGQRRLHFRPALARMNVELELEDRTVKEVDIPAWRGSVIDAFASDRPDPDDGARAPYHPASGLTVPQLVHALDMEEALVLDALHFWVKQRVLYQMAPDTYAVLERLDMDTTAYLSSAPAASAHPIAAVKSPDAMLRDGAPMFSAFIANMLRNGGAKEVGGMMGIAGMLKMVLPAFVYGEEEVLWLLGEMEARGEVVRSGDTWAIAP